MLSRQRLTTMSCDPKPNRHPQPDFGLRPGALRRLAHEPFPLICGALLMLAVGPAGAHELHWDAAADRVSADLIDAPLQLVLEQVRVATGWEIAIEPGVEHPVSTTFNGLKSGEALARLLRPTSFALLHRTNAAHRLLVFNTSMDRATRAILQGADAVELPAGQIDDELIVTLAPGTDAEALARKLGATVTGSIDKLGAYRLKFENAGAAQAARSALENDDSVKRVDANYAIERPAGLQPLMHSNGRLPQIKPPSAGTDGRLIVGLVDTAVQVPAGELAKFFLEPVSLAGEFNPTDTVPTHGTGMSSDILNAIASMVGQGNTANVAILPIDVFGAGESTSTFQLGQGMVEAWNRGATLINGSIGSKAESAWLNEVIDRLTGYGALLVAPSGNTPDGLPTYPAAHPSVLAVTAVGPDGQLAPYANMASFVDVAMPGNSVVNLTGLPYFMAGTSVATARATGAIAGYSLRSGQSLSAAQQYLRQTRGVQPGAQISP